MNNRYTARLIKRKNQENKENDMQFFLVLNVKQILLIFSTRNVRISVV